MLKIIASIVVCLLVSAVIAVFAMQAPTSWKVAETIRTPDDRFQNLPNYPFAANYADVLGYRVHYVDEGPRDGQPILLMHGQPSWSYLYRHMIPPLADAGYRVIAPDLVGFGKSDKPLKTSDHNYQMHVDVMSEFVRQLDLEDVTFFGQDWGGLIGLRVVAEEQDRFARVMISNTGLPAAGGIGGLIAYPIFRLAVMREGSPEEVADNGEFRFTRWVAWAKNVDDFDYPGLFQQSTTRELTDAELAGYAAPFPDETYQAATRIFPSMVPSQLRQNDRVMRTVYENWEKPFLTAFGDRDPVTAGMDTIWHERVPGAVGQSHTTIEGGHHFIQEDKPKELVTLLIEFIDGNP